MPKKCCVPNCKGNYTAAERVSVFKFPKDEVLRKLWVDKIPRKDFIPNDYTVVCANHFCDDFVVRVDSVTRPDGSVLTVKRDIPKLTKEAYPSIFPNCPSYLSETPAAARKAPDERRREAELIIAKAVIRPAEMTSQFTEKTKRNGDSKLAQNGNTAQAETEAVQVELELRKLAFRNPGKFMESFDPEKSSREMKKLKQRMMKDKGRKRAFYDSQGVLYSNGEDWCDCLDISCPGCHFPCPKCESPKCGSECRTNRRWHYQYVMQDWQGEEIIEWPFEPQPFDDGK